MVPGLCVGAEEMVDRGWSDKKYKPANRPAPAFTGMGRSAGSLFSVE